MVFSLAKGLLAVQVLAGLALAGDYDRGYNGGYNPYQPNPPKTVTTTVISKVYETHTVTTTSCYTKTLAGEITTITESYTTTSVAVSYCTETVTTTDKEYETETISIEGPTETIYKPTTEVDYTTIYKDGTTVKETETCTETQVIPTTIYVKKYKTKTVYQEPETTTCYVPTTYYSTDYDQVVKTVTTEVPVPTTVYKHKYEVETEYVPTTIWKKKYDIETVTLPGVTHIITEVEGETKYVHKTEYITVQEQYTVTNVEHEPKPYTVTEPKPYTVTVVPPPPVETPTYSPTVAPVPTPSYTPPPVATGAANRLNAASGAFAAVALAVAAAL